MFEPTDENVDELKLAISLPDLHTTDFGHLISLDDLPSTKFSELDYDAWFLSGIGSKYIRNLTNVCETQGIELVVFDSPYHDTTAIHDVVVNLANKLFSKEMPNNIDIADIRNLNQSSDHLLAFNSKREALCFLKEQELGEVIGGVYLAHGGTDLEEYEKSNKALQNHISDYGFLCSSFLSTGIAECTILLGVRSK
ncbi:hypothetical protein [Vibrio maerlii]|uniref:hypothetical protein n=1 Tax=Vibrio maerlii TaxID=2231648 RepID=UPI000E3D8946|nr:hypothetical protein [Vibrio maerlii]